MALGATTKKSTVHSQREERESKTLTLTSTQSFREREKKREKKKKKMSSTLLEVTRSAHEEVERLERLIVKDLQNEPTSNKDRLFQSHRVRNMIDTIISTTDKLVLSLSLSLLAMNRM